MAEVIIRPTKATLRFQVAGAVQSVAWSVRTGGKGTGSLIASGVVDTTPGSGTYTLPTQSFVGDEPGSLTFALTPYAGENATGAHGETVYATTTEMNPVSP